ncbi:TetR family transcriptional regulator [Chitinivorax sp. PXF-14]|uniref:TetR family transcriptional regulator n=1 Tax=Chitinivorax sp. PXF-14 TaxID=3230488 RepID=UPI0034670758
MARRTKEEAQETRCQLLDAAEQVFSEKGVAHTSLADVAAAAGLTRGAIYWHFKNKADLLDAMCDRATMPMEELLEAYTESTSSPLQRIRLRAAEALRQTAHDARFRSMLIIVFHKCEYVDELSAVKERHLQSRNECVEQVTQEFTDSVAAGELPADLDPRRAAIGLFAFFDGLVYNWLLDPTYFDIDTNAQYWVDQYLGGVRQPLPDPGPEQETKPAAASRGKRCCR